MPASTRFDEQQLVIVVIDLARFTPAMRSVEATAIATLVDRVYRDFESVIEGRGGTIVKLMGDACFATFPTDRVMDALDAVRAFGPALAATGAATGVTLEYGANVHIATAAVGDFGLHGSREVIGAGVNHTFLMGNGPGIRISEPVYRKLASADRSGWSKHQPPATYTWEG